MLLNKKSLIGMAIVLIKNMMVSEALAKMYLIIKIKACIIHIDGKKGFLRNNNLDFKRVSVQYMINP